jgi:hypothetical protein
MSRLRKRLARSDALIFVIMVLFVLLLPIILPIVLIQDRIRTRRIAKVVCSLVCIFCHTQLGMEAVQLGDERWSAIVTDLHARFPVARFRLLRDIHAVCPRCGCEYAYRDADCSLVLSPRYEPNKAMHATRENARA